MPNDRPLTEEERAMLTREHAAAFTTTSLPSIFDQFGILPDVYWLKIHRLIEREEALAEYPVVVAHLRKVRETRRR